MSDTRSGFRRFIDFVWGFIATIYKIVMILSVVLFIGIAWLLLKGGPPVTVDDNVALVIWPAGEMVDQVDQERRLLERFSGEVPSQTALRELIEALETAADDARISTVVLKLDALSDAGMPQLVELVAAMKKFQAGGKTIHAYGPYFDQTGYLAAAAADDISIDPMGSVLIEGFGAYNNYFKDALDKLGIKMNVFRVGEFKAAVEPFLRNDMSEEARRANQEWLGDLWADYGRLVGAPRKLPETAVSQYVNGYRAGIERLKGDGATLAREAGLVTHVESLQEFRQRIGAVVGFDDDHGSFRQIHYSEYLRAVGYQKEAKVTDAAGSLIALVVVQGEIVDGIGEPGQAGGDDIAELLDEARRDENVAAVVLRINSPGGSAWASEVIRRSVLALKAEGKPVVASMSSVAASGGYWVAMDADQIWAHESTITGSIGIFGLIPTIDEPLGKLGIHTDGVGTTPLAGAFRIDRPLSGDVAAIFQAEVEKGYRDFVGGVAAGRKLELAKVEAIAQGRVWSGADAKGFGLIDSFGGLEQASAAAAKLAGLEEGAWSLEEMRPEAQFPSRLLDQFFGSIGLRIPALAALHPWLAVGERVDASTWLKRFSNDRRGIYAHCMCAPDGASTLRGN